MAESNPKIDIEWRSAQVELPSPGMFVALSRDEIHEIDRTYWSASNWSPAGLFWRPVPAPNFLGIGGPVPDAPRPPIEEDFWFVVLIEPQQEVRTIWRLHETGRELFVPVIRRRVPTGRRGKNGHRVTRILPRPMFPGYGLIRQTGITDINDLLAVRGVRQVLRDDGRPIVLPHDAVLAIFRKQMEKHLDFTKQTTGRQKRPTLRRGQTVRVQAQGNVYDGLIAQIDKVDGKGRIELLLGMAKIRHTLPEGMVVAA